MKKDYWKQPGPGMQITAILSSLDGHHDNMYTGIISKTKYDNYFKQHMKDLLELANMLHHTKWDE